MAVNTVGGFRGGKRVHETDPEEWEFLFRLNVMTTVNVCRAVVPVMIARRSGRIVNVASQAALAGQANIGAYSAAKSAVVRLTETLAAELRDEGITVNCVLPGTMDTPQNREAMPKADTSKWVQPEVVAALIAYLASDSSQVASGTAIPVGRL